DAQRRERSAPVLVAELCSSFQEAGVKIEDVSRIRFASRRPSQEQRNLAIRCCMLREIVVNDQGMPFIVAEIFTYGRRGIRSNVLHARRLGGRSRYHKGVIHRAI